MRKALEKGGELADTCTGKRVEELFTEYSNLHTKVVLGLSQDFEVRSAEVENLKTVRVEEIKKIRRLAERVGRLEDLVQEHKAVSTQDIEVLR